MAGQGTGELVVSVCLVGRQVVERRGKVEDGTWGHSTMGACVEGHLRQLVVAGCHDDEWKEVVAEVVAVGSCTTAEKLVPGGYEEEHWLPHRMEMQM